MVRHQNPLQAGNLYRENWYRIPQEPEFVPASAPPTTAAPPVHTRPTTIEEALRGCAGIPVKAYALIVRLENDEDKVYSSPSLASVRDRIFTEAFRTNFRRRVKSATERHVDYQQYTNHGFNQGFSNFDTEGSSGGNSRKHSGGDTSSSDAKKRRVPLRRIRGEPEDDMIVPVIKKTQSLQIGNSADVEKFYLQRFKDMHQWSCKIMGKLFVKLIEPKKQTNHPYTRGDDKKPPWWPHTKGENHVRHREPDHLLKPERIRLLVHILRMVIQPHAKQHPSVKKLDLNVSKLEEITMEAMASWFNDKDHPGNLKKKPFLKEIFKVAKSEERYLNGELDDTQFVTVMNSECTGTDDSENEEDEMKNEEDDTNDDILTSTIPANMSSPDNMISPSTVQAPQHENETRSQLPMRRGQSDDMPHYSANIDSSYYNSRSMSYTQSPPDQEHRSFVPSLSYPSPQPSMYTNGWPVMNNASSTPYYMTSPQQSVNHLPPISHQHLPPVPSFSTSQSRYDTSPALGSTLRTGSMSHPHTQLSQHNGNVYEYHPPYLSDHYQQQDPSMKMEQLHHTQ